MEALQLMTPAESPILFPVIRQRQEVLPRLIKELSDLVSQLGSHSGSLTPSVYDTAQVLRFAPPMEGVEPGLDWLMKNQEVDGGWGNPIAPFMRDVPTLATILALHQYNYQGRYDRAIQAGLKFLQQQSDQWQDFSVDDLLVGVELILPNLVEEAIQKKLDISYQPYVKLNKIGTQKRKIIQNLKVVHGTPAAFSWEAWGDFPDRYLLDAIHSVGNSTSATAAWIARTRANELPFDVAPSLNYLQLASNATNLNIPGVVPFAWPINRFEQAFGLYAITIGGLLSHPTLSDNLNKQINNLFTALTPYGMPFSDHFIPDLDDTAASIVVFRAYGMEINPEILQVFKNDNGYFTYPGEFHASISAHARAVHALSFLSPNETFQAQQVLLPFQNLNGVWPGDKWHKSWLYTTSHMLYALNTSPHLYEIEKGLKILVDEQNKDGGWGCNYRSTTAETAYVMLALQMYRKQYPYLEDAYQNGYTWLFDNIDRVAVPGESLWIGKELFKPFRIDRAFELTALIQAILTS